MTCFPGISVADRINSPVPLGWGDLAESEGSEFLHQILHLRKDNSVLFGVEGQMRATFPPRVASPAGEVDVELTSSPGRAGEGREYSSGYQPRIVHLPIRMVASVTRILSANPPVGEA